MEVIPAIDLRGGKCVRLYQGDYRRETVYSEDPVEVAARWASQGATRLHIVDLDGARSGAPANLTAVKDIAAAVSIPIQLGGGIRTIDTVTAVMALGVDRVMIGTSAVESPDFIQTLFEHLSSDEVVVSVDARDGFVAVKGWTRPTEILASELISKMVEKGVRRFMYTDIARDGTLTEPNFGAIQDLLNRIGVTLLAAGGISSLPHLTRLAELGVEGAVVGQALYTGAIELREALVAVS